MKKQPKPKINHTEKKVKQYRATCPICDFTFVGKSELERGRLDIEGFKKAKQKKPVKF